MAQEVSHTGRVISVDPDLIKVEIISRSACSSCHAAGLCSMSEAVKKIIEVPAAGNRGYKPGDEVDVLLTASMGMKAVLLAYVLPLVVLLVCCVALSYTHIKELYTGLAGLGGVALYYLIIYFIRGRFEKEYIFTIRKR